MTDFTHDTPGTSAKEWHTHPRWTSIPRLDLWQTQPDRVVVLAAHPDDESLGAGGLIAEAARRGLQVDLLLLTDGEGSHPGSPTHTPELLARRRRTEGEAAARALGVTGDVVRLGLSDGDVAAHHTCVVRRVVDVLGDARRTLLVAPWRGDGHPDHEAAGHVAAAVAVRTGARLLEYPVWFWHWSSPDSAPWDLLGAVGLDEGARSRKEQAIAAHVTQVQRLSELPGDEVLLSDDLLEHFGGDVEVFVTQPPTDPALDDLHGRDEDPWGTQVRWFEQRKRDLTLAALPRPAYGRTLEVGCSRGTLTRALAARSQQVLALDASPRAVELARQALSDLATVEVREAQVPREWPAGEFDLVVVSEVAYFLSPVALEELVERIRGCLTPDGTVVLAHWRHHVEGWPMDGPHAHDVVRAAGLRPELGRWTDRDVEIVVLGAETTRPDPTG
ncbi:bifunctional PIG-L family deacetylase/class I SAM-dependent methyltransferase [Nocardioides sp.]|uniref:bifunctional PIG-L family deacetylase/class I SAM-dependent methyltransferase n=1 Tax=Nocardioides sp. TaxID=35761 RepID=UPI00286AAFAD|nr:bifunctional PIG-L family deacetylase/class I SAM-dependent methyltransferase [Nocardioides sp.]